MGQVYLDANEEAKRRGDRRVGTEHIALALLRDPDSSTARALGVSLSSARTALEDLDRQALAALGIEASPVGPVLPGREKDRLRLTPAGREVFTGLRRTAAGERLGVKHVLVALLARQRPDPAAELFAALGVDAGQVRARLDQS
jgi:ATP-dependent Clp protease ATP-binding subunit ClpA